MRTRFHRRRAAPVNVCQHGAAAFRHPYGGLVGDIGAHALGRHQPRTLAQQHTYHFRGQPVANLIHRRHPSEPHEERFVYLYARTLQPLADDGQDIGRVGRDRGG